jgi:hypothetical protein
MHFSFANLQVNRAKSFMDHLMVVLGKQRHSAYGLFRQLHALRDQLFLLEISSGLSIRQEVVLTCMWQQKVILSDRYRHIHTLLDFFSHML